MEDLVETLTRGNPTEVKVVLASVVGALAVYQVVLAAFAYGRLRAPFLGPRPAAGAHRASGDAIVAITVVVALFCVSAFGFESDQLAHIVAASALLAALALKVLAVRRGGAAGRFLPAIGVAVLALFVITWLTSAGSFLAAT